MNWLPLASLFIILFFLNCGSAYSQNFSAPLKVSTGLNSNDHSPEMHIGRDGTIYVSWFTDKANIYFASSKDGGQTFSNPVRAVRQITTNGFTSQLQRAPEFAIDTKGIIHLVWAEERVAGNSDVWYVRSGDGGMTWSTPASIMDAGDSMKFAQDFAAIAVDSSDNLYVSYLDNRYLMQKLSTHYRLHMQKSIDGGKSWMKPVIADDIPSFNSGTCECCRQDIAVSDSGHVYIAFRSSVTVSSELSNRDIYVARSLDAGTTFEVSVWAQLGNWTLGECPTTGPHIALDRNENLHITWRDNRNDSVKAISYYTMLSNRLLGKYWYQLRWNYSLSDSKTETSNWPDITVAPNGALAAAYMSDQLMLTYSTDGGNNWNGGLPYPQTSMLRQLPILQYSPSGTLYSVWQEDASDGGDILFSKITGLTQPNGIGPMITSVQPTYLTGREVIFGWSIPQALRLASNVWYTVHLASPTIHIDTLPYGRVFNLDSLPAGNYTWSIVAHTTVDSSRASGSFKVLGPLDGVPMRHETSVISAFPNPIGTDRVVTLQFSNAAAASGEILNITVIDERGDQVRSWTIDRTGSAVNLDLGTLAAGAYQCEVRRGKTVNRLPIVVQ